ncbi:hypothetical protein [Citrobacter portucalensis]|uniref:hypothetical protein n=1 Tax=Citrobacter portucalensis TaxID=1639133 RepID=UPI0021BE1C25|nr:hypothetical protein [Citrobacter portucalensis]
MSKIVRYQGDVRAFASDAQGMERTVFGGTNQADDLTSQITASFLRGWGTVGASEHPSLEDFNAAMYAMSQFIAYQHQMGVPEWHAEQEYHIGSICTHNGESYQSLQNANIGSQPPSAKWTPVLTSKNGLANLGLTNFADKNSSNEQMFNGVVASKKGVSAASSDGRRRVNLFVSDTGYELIVYIDGEYNNSIKIPTKYGTMALLDDVSNSVQSAPPPIGIPFFWPVSAMPNTVVPEWSSNVFLKMNDATFSASTYPALARVWPGLKLTDCRGEFLRIWDDGRGVDGGRALLSAQSDAIRNITGNVGVYSDGLLTYASGAFSLGPSASNKNNPISGGGANAYATFDASKVVPTASENRPRNVAFNLLVRAK